MDDRTLRQLTALSRDIWALWGEGSAVVCLRLTKLARGGPAAKAEAELMVSEKIAAQQELLGRLVSGKFGTSPVAVTAGVTRYVLRGVRANRRRLSRR